MSDNFSTVLQREKVTNKASSRLNVDSIDRQILRILQQDGRTTRQEIAKMLNLSKSAVQYRIRKLENNGVIEGYYAKINPSKMGNDYQAITLVRAKFSPTYHEKVGKRLAALPGVWAVYFTFGDNDFVMMTRGTSREDLLKSVDNMTKLEGIERTSSQLVVKTIKEDTRLDL